MAWNELSKCEPKESGEYLVFVNASSAGSGYGDFIEVTHFSSKDRCFNNDFNWLVTHWQKLPEFPGKK